MARRRAPPSRRPRRSRRGDGWCAARVHAHSLGQCGPGLAQPRAGAQMRIRGTARERDRARGASARAGLRGGPDRAPGSPAERLEHVAARCRSLVVPGPTARRPRRSGSSVRMAARMRDRRASRAAPAVKSPLCQPPRPGSSRTRNWISTVTPARSQTRNAASPGTRLQWLRHPEQAVGRIGLIAVLGQPERLRGRR